MIRKKLLIIKLKKDVEQSVKAIAIAIVIVIVYIVCLDIFASSGKHMAYGRAGILKN